jgi:hypothetical protein
MRPPRSTLQPIGQIIANATPKDTAAIAADLQQLTRPAGAETHPARNTMSASQQLAAVRFASGTDRPANVAKVSVPDYEEISALDETTDEAEG